MRQQDQQINDNGPDVVRSEPVPVTGPGQADSGLAGRARTDYPEGTADQGPEDALDERGSYGNDLADGPGPWSGTPSSESRTRDERLGHDRLPEERADDDTLDDDGLADRTPAAPTGSGDRADEPGTGDRGDLADASQADAGDRRDADSGDRRPDPDGDDPDGDDPGPDRREFHEPAPLPTTFGAPTVGGAVAASALAGSHRDAREDDTVRSGDGPADDRIDGIDDEPDRDYSAVRTEGDHHAARDDDEDRSLGAADATSGHRSTVVDHGPVDGVDSDQTAVVGTSHPVNPDVLSAGNPDAVTGGDRGADDADPARAVGSDSENTGVAADGGTSEGELLPGAAPAEPIVAILDQDTVRSFRDRWRDVQLRFVDDPPGATADAHRLVEESVDALTAALTAQRAELGGWQHDGATDTEQLRMVVRRHRDFLDRLLGS